MTSSQRTVVAINVCLVVFAVGCGFVIGGGFMATLFVPAVPLLLLGTCVDIRMFALPPWMILLASWAAFTAVQVRVWRRHTPWLAVLLFMYFVTGIFVTGLVVMLFANWRGN